jgi:TRAP-type C4-dicarboxylate transport system substrate-binding protein
MKRMLIRMMLAIAIISVSMVTVTFGADEFPEMELRYANFVPESNPTSKADVFVATELTKRTNGRVKVTMYHGGSMGKSTEMIDLVGEGAIEIGNFSSGYNFARLPMQAFFGVPIIMKDAPMVGKLLRAAAKTQTKMQEDWKKNNLYPFNFRGLPAYRLIATKPLRTLEDLKGLRVRTFGKTSPKVFKSLGAVPVNMTVGEAYEGLQRGSVDAVYLPWAGMYVYKLHEVAKYISDINFGADGCYVTYLNLDVWNSWPQNLKDLFNQIVTEAELMSDQMVNGIDKKLLGAMQQAGAELVHFEDQDKLINAVPDPIGLVEAEVASVGGEYKKAAKIYADFLRTEIAKMEKAE